MKAKTYREAHAAIMDRLESDGWTVSRHLKVPHATRPDGLRAWFKSQAVYVGWTTKLGDARSIYTDVRTEPIDSTLQAVEYFANC